MSERGRNVVDYIAYVELIAYVRSISDSIWTANAGLGPFLNGNASARRGREVQADEVEA